MVDPLSISTGVLTLLGVCVNVGVELKTFRNSVTVVDATINGLLRDVENLQQVLESMKDTFEADITGSATGHIGNHWRNVSKSLQNGQNTLNKLQELLEGVNRSTTILDGPRKQVRLKAAMEQIATFRHQIQSYRDALHLSLQTVTL
jgi:hypothetical protein